MGTKELIYSRNTENPFSVYIGVQTVKIEAGYAETILPVRQEHLNMYGIVHGGCLYTLADIAAGSAVASHGCKAVTASGEYHYLGAAKGAREIKAIAKTVKFGRTLVISDVELLTDTGVLVGKGTFTHCILS